MNIMLLLSIIVILMFGVKYLTSKKDREQKITEGLKNGTIKIIQPKHPQFKHLEIIGSLLLFFIMFYIFYIVDEGSSCQLIFGLNAQFVKEISYSLFSLPMMLFFLFWNIEHYFMLRRNKGKFYPDIDKQPLFLENICQIINDEMIYAQKSILTAVLAIFAMFFIYPPNLEIFPLKQTNIKYQQQCLIDLEKNSEY